MARYITCITRMMLNSHSAPAMTHCDGSEKLIESHCQFCDYYIGNDPEYEVDDPVIFEHEEREWEEEEVNNEI